MTSKNKRWKKLIEYGTVIVCPYCLKPILNPADLTIEHEPPKSRQKELSKTSKTFYACKRCNHEKGALTAEEYTEWKRLNDLRNGHSR